MNRPIRSTLSSRSLSLIGVPKKFHEISLKDFKTFDSSDLEEVKDFFSEYIENLQYNVSKGKGIYMYGSNGVGKTMLSCLLAKEAYRHRYSTRRVTFVEYINLYTKMWGVKTTDEKETLEQDFYSYYKAVEFLILEEVGKEIDSKVAAPILEDCLRYREDNGLTTVICTNLRLSVLKERYGESCFSLLTGNMTPICIEGDDMRKKAFNEV